MRHHLLREADLPQYRTPGHRHPPNRKDDNMNGHGMNGARQGQHERSVAAAPGDGTGMPLAARAVMEERMKTLLAGRARPGRNGDAGRGRGVIPRYALASRCPGGMSANLAPGCDDAETGPRAVLAMMAAELAADPPKEGEMQGHAGERNAPGDGDGARAGRPVERSTRPRPSHRTHTQPARRADAGRRGWLRQHTIALRTTTSMNQNARARVSPPGPAGGGWARGGQARGGRGGGARA
jgi:hypothetical protein